MSDRKTPPLQIGITPSQELYELAQSTKRMLERLLRVADAPAEVQAARELVEQASSLLQERAAPGDRPHFTLEGQEADTRPYYFPANHERPVHVSMPTMEVRPEGTTWRGRVRFDLIHEGPPGAVHGGFVAYFFDNMLGQLIVANEIYGPTRELRVQYLEPTPVLRDLQFELTIEPREGRRVPALARLHDGTTCTAEAKATFLTPAAGSAPAQALGPS